MMSISIRPFSSCDFAGVLELLAHALPQDPISASRFTRQILLDPNFRIAGAPVACSGKEIIGFCLSIARQVPLENALPDHDRGYITLLAVAPDYQSCGIGSRLLEMAEEYLRKHNRRHVLVSPYAPNYFIPGVDVGSYSRGLRFFMSQGYCEIYRPLSMQVSLYDLCVPDWIIEREQKLRTQNVLFTAYEPEWTLPLLQFLEQEFPGDWVRVGREAMARICQGESSQRLWIALDVACAQPRVLAFSHWENERFGPIGVAQEERGRGLGQILMYKALNAQREAGFDTAWFLWSDDVTAARLYSAAGFQEVRRFALLQKDLT